MGILTEKLKEFDKFKNGILASGEKIIPENVPESWLRKLQSEIDAIKKADPDGRNELKAVVADVVWWEKEMAVNPCPTGGGLGRAMNTLRNIGKSDIQGVWDILSNGTEDEFSALCNCLPEISGEFENDDSLREVMRISKQRLKNAKDYENLIAGIKGCFGNLFDKFWNETEPIIKTRKFNRVIYGK